MSMGEPGPAAESAAYRAFREGFYRTGYGIWPQAHLLDALDPAERARAEQQLLDDLDVPDLTCTAAVGLARLKSRRAIAPLRALMRGRRDRRRVAAAQALWRIDEDEEALQTLCAVVEHRPFLGGRKWERADAASALAFIDRRVALVTLIGAVDDPNSLVSACAQSAMRKWLWLDGEADALKRREITIAEFRAAAWAELARARPDSP